MNDALAMSGSYLDTFDREPFSFYEKARALGEISWDGRMKSWVVVGHDLAKAILHDIDGFAQIHGSTQAADEYRHIRANNPRSMQFVPAQTHRAFRNWWLTELLSPAAVRRYREAFIDPWIDILLDGLAGREGFELCAEFSDRIPMGVFAGIFDFPQRDAAYLDHLKHLNDVLAQFSTIANAGLLEGERTPEAQKVADDAIAAASELDGILLPLVRARRGGEGDDLISRLWHGGAKIFPDWNEIDTLDACRRLLFAGVDTTTHAIGNAFHMLLTDHALFRQVSAGDEALVARFAEEVLRLNGSVHFRPRLATRDMELGGQQVRAGDRVTVMLLGANRDPEHYACPHAVDLNRARPTDHLSFSSGTRTCLGAHVARAELVSVLPRTLGRFPALRLAEGAEPPSFTGFLMRSYRPLHVLCA